LKVTFAPKNERNKIAFSLLTIILLVSTFVAAQGNLVRSPAQTANNTPLEYAYEDTVQSTSANSQETNVPKTSSSLNSEIDEFESSTTGSKIDKLRFKVTPAMSPPPPDEVLYPDDFSGLYTDWTLVGTSPYIDAVDYPTNYIEETDYYGVVGRFSFQNTTLGTISWGRIEAYAQSEWSGIDGDIYLRGTVPSTVWAGSIEAGTGWSWVPTSYVTEIPSDFLTSAEINSLTMMIMYWTDDGSSGPAIRIDAVRLALWKDPWSPPSAPTAKVQAMKNGQLDAVTDLATVAEIDALNDSCFTVTSAVGFQMFHIGFNIRSDQSYRADRPSEELPYVASVLSDVNFRHALIHCYDQLGIIPPIYGYTVTPIRSLVPPAQSKYYNPAVMAHPYNPGNPFTSSPGDGSSCGILKAAGYTFVDADSSGTVTDADYWTKAGFGGAPLPTLRLFTPTIAAAPTSYQHGLEIINDLKAIGLNNMENTPQDFSSYYTAVFQNAEFDMYMMGWSLGRLPTQLYTMMHSSQDSHLHPGAYNAPGINDPYVDTRAETVMFSLDPNQIEQAAKELQTYMYDPSVNSQAFPYMQLYSRTYFNAFNPGIRGIVNSLGFGSNNMWTFLNVHWEPGHPYERIESGKSTVVWGIDSNPSSLNPLYTSDKNALEITDRVCDSLMTVNPYNHYDVGWIATDWSIAETTGGMEISFTIRNDVTWQDGKPLTAYDIEWYMEFLRDRHVPKYASCCQTLVDVVVTDNTHFKIVCNKAGIGLFYEWAGLPLLPRHIWDRPWASDQAVLDYDPTEPYNVAPGYTAGPTPPPTNLFGTGPFTFQFYQYVSQYCDMLRNENYFMSQTAIQALMTEMFWASGDVNRDGVVDQIDWNLYEAAYGSSPGQPNWNPDCDLNLDDFIDFEDGSIIAYSIGKRREYPEEIIDVAILDVTAFPTVVYPGQKINITTIAKNKGNAGFTTNFTFYCNYTLIDDQIITNLIPCHNTTMNYIWDTTGVSPGIYTISVNATVLDGLDVNLTDNSFVNGKVKIGTTKIAVDPHKSIAGSAGKNFTINITITDAPYNATWAWEFKLSWNASLLNITDVKEGAFLSQSGTWATAFANFTNQSEGWVLVSCTLTDDPIQHGQPLPDGNGTLATISFIALNLGNCTLHLSDTILLNYNIDPYYHTTQDGEFEVLLGDVDRNGIIDTEDVKIIKLAYGSVPGSPNWNPEADIWGPDGKPDGFINVYDLAMCGKKFGGTA
jgi:ABC-type transport system substrate-binding protein